MAWDLRAALLRKGEVESDRLDDFAFRERARAMRLLARELGQRLDAADLVPMIAVAQDDAILAEVLLRCPDLGMEALQAIHARCRLQARAELIAEIGDPTPHRLA